MVLLLQTSAHRINLIQLWKDIDNFFVNENKPGKEGKHSIQPIFEKKNYLKAKGNKSVLTAIIQLSVNAFHQVVTARRCRNLALGKDSID